MQESGDVFSQETSDTALEEFPVIIRTDFSSLPENVIPLNETVNLFLRLTLLSSAADSSNTIWSVPSFSDMIESFLN